MHQKTFYGSSLLRFQVLENKAVVRSPLRGLVWLDRVPFVRHKCTNNMDKNKGKNIKMNIYARTHACTHEHADPHTCNKCRRVRMYD